MSRTGKRARYKVEQEELERFVLEGWMTPFHRKCLEVAKLGYNLDGFALVEVVFQKYATNNYMLMMWLELIYKNTENMTCWDDPETYARLREYEMFDVKDDVVSFLIGKYVKREFPRRRYKLTKKVPDEIRENFCADEHAEGRFHYI